MWADKSKYLFGLWHGQMYANEEQYKLRLQNKLSPQEARGALANDAKTELIMYASLQEWKYILNTDTMRCSKHADPEMQRIMLPLREQFKEQYPEAEW
jgi:thymidylate synthase ThyX